MFSKKSRQIEAKTHCLLKGLGIGFRYRRLTDTLRIVQRDSIPYGVTVTEVKDNVPSPSSINYADSASGSSPPA